MKKLLTSIFTIGAVGAVAFGTSRAFFSDVEVSSANVFQAGGLDLKVDSDCHYWQNGQDLGCGDGPGSGNWELTDLETGVHKFFNFEDLKPGDRGENTVSLHVFDNDAWLRMLVDVTDNLENGCTEPESDVDSSCTDPGAGELLNSLVFHIWFDDGLTPGYGGKHIGGGGDNGEGNNVQDHSERTIFTGKADALSELNFWEELSDYRAAISPICEINDADGDGKTASGQDGCQGIAVDGRMVASTTYFFGIGWELPALVGNEVQTDSLTLDMTFEVEQHRNNPIPFGP